MTTRKLDRRIMRTRQMLRDALMQLIIKQGYDTITVQEIADAANVARTTFYLHFKDKDELLFEGMRELYEELFEAMKQDPASNPLGLPFDLDNPTDYEHVARYADFYRVMLSERGSISFLLRVQDYLAKILLETAIKPLASSQTRMPVEFMAYSLAGGQIAGIKWWLDQDMQYSPQEMAIMCKNLFLCGTPWALGLPPMPPDEAV